MNVGLLGQLTLTGVDDNLFILANCNFFNFILFLPILFNFFSSPPAPPRYFFPSETDERQKFRGFQNGQNLVTEVKGHTVFFFPSADCDSLTLCLLQSSL